MKIKLSYRTEDIIAWHFEGSDIFSVKSAYKLVMNLSTLDTHDSSNDNKTEDVYGGIYGKQIFLLKSKSLHGP